MNHASQPIGIFDSGIGGLTVAQAIVKTLPNESIIYFGDTAHLPYGEKSAASIQAYAIQIADMLLEKQCKLILIACHSASSAAFDLIKDHVGNKAIILNVIDPVIGLLKSHYAGKKIGLIGTRQTVNSAIYNQKINALKANITLSACATNLLASAIEEFGNHEIIDSLLKQYLSHPDLQNIDALILACTHYPIVKDKVARLFHPSIDIIDSSDTVSKAVKLELAKNDLINPQKMGSKHFYVSDYTTTFETNAKLFFDETITLEHYPL